MLLDLFSSQMHFILFFNAEYIVDKIGGTFEELPLTSLRLLPKELVNYAVEHNVTRIVLGHSKQTRWQELWQGSVVNKLLQKT
jgi:two-component system sensor histidine kinase KdpD